jgi:peptidoglycan hydrolase FlgJ
MVAQASSLGVDSRSLDALRNEASRDPRAASRQAAVQFESMFMQMVMKSMREATMKAEEGGSAGQETFTGMLDEQFSKQFAGRPGGLADMIERQLTRHMGNLPPVSAENQAAAQAAAAQAAARAQLQVTPSASTPSTAATTSTVSALDASGKPRSRSAEFLAKMMPHAKEAERQTGVPASFILGQAALESGWGKSEIRKSDGSTSHNLFGIKATGWQGESTNARTTEYVNGVATKQTERFRSYGSYAEAFADYARMLSNNPRYANVVRNARSAEHFAGGMQRAGYATDPQYANKLAKTINQALAVQRAMG